MKNLLALTALTIISTFIIPIFGQERKSELPDLNIIRIKPADWKPSKRCPKMPSSIVKYLENLSCTIPQSNFAKNNHNAFQGEFVKKGQYDWAVLCSRNNISSILMFFNGSTENVGEFAKYPDRDFIRGTDERSGFGYLRAIGKDALRNLSESDKKKYGDIFPKIDYLGIDEITSDRKSVIYYIFEGQLLVLENGVRN